MLGINELRTTMNSDNFRIRVVLLYEETRMPKSNFDTRPKKSVSADSRPHDLSSDDTDGVHVREHERESGKVHVKRHSRRKGLLTRLKTTPKTEKSPSKEFMDNMDAHATKVEDMLTERSEDNI
jgi:hypothetical protein